MAETLKQTVDRLAYDLAGYFEATEDADYRRLEIALNAAIRAALAEPTEAMVNAYWQSYREGGTIGKAMSAAFAERLKELE
jgi:hypothetical protein